MTVIVWRRWYKLFDDLRATDYLRNVDAQALVATSANWPPSSRGL